jgi:hypothetical protein
MARITETANRQTCRSESGINPRLTTREITVNPAAASKVVLPRNPGPQTPWPPLNAR